MGTLPRSAPGSGEPGRGRVGGYRALRRQGWKFSLTQPPRPGPAPDSGKRELGGGRSRVCPSVGCLSPWGSFPVRSHPLPRPRFPPRRATGGAASRLAPPLGPRSPGCAAGRLRSLLRYRGLAPGKPCCCGGGGWRKSGGDTRGCAPLPGAPQTLPAGEAPGGTGSCPGEAPRVRSARRLRAPPQPARLVRPQPGAGPRDVRLLGEEKKITHMHKKCVFCALGLGGVTVSVRGRKSRRARGGVRAPPATLPHPPSSAPAPTEPLQGSAGPGGGGRGLPPPGGKIAEIAAPGATGQSPARWGLRTARSRPLFMEESSVHMYLV